MPILHLVNREMPPVAARQWQITTDMKGKRIYANTESGVKTVERRRQTHRQRKLSEGEPNVSAQCIAVR